MWTISRTGWVFAMVLIGFFNFQSQSLPIENGSANYRSNSNILQVEDFNLDNFSVNAIHRKPFRIISSKISSWNAFRWNLREWVDKWPMLHDVLEFPRHGAGETFPMENNAPTESPEFDFVPYEVISELSLLEFFNETSSLDRCRFYSTNFRVLESWAGLENDTNWRALQVIENLGKHFDKSIYNIAPLFNILYPNCSLQTRYSEYHTTIVQLNGSTTYHFISPDKQYLLRPYPYHHPYSARHSQINLDDEDVNVSDLGLQSVTITAGEVLYVPPGYMVHTESTITNISISLEILSPSKEQILLLESLMIPLPFSIVNKTMEEKIISTQIFLVHVLSRVKGMKSIVQFISSLYHDRYELLFPRDSMSMLTDPFDCYNTQPELHERILNSLMKEKFVDTAELIANRFNDKHLPKALKWSWVENFIDGTLRNVLGDGVSLRESALFLKECLNFEGKLEVIEEVPGPSVVKLDPKY